MSTISGVRYRVRWVRCLVALGVSNATIGALLGLMYWLYSFGFDWGSIAESGDGGAVWSSVLASAVFGLLVPTGLSLLSLVPQPRSPRSWPMRVAVGPVACSLLSFIFVWYFPAVLAFVALAAVGGGALSILAVRLVNGVRTEVDCEPY
ncbi:hypothetical protein HCX50_02440 [Microbacterium oxydans]|uniref:hypothetical protein n=1 Tax=Microbacterium sp. B19(2022) TaxID=2914045 RepID=UPI001431DA9F|nr:hypothetical protein [Microbacterium sp. B19(2022)]NJI58283.1 hypothetical protein [Microbacterium sp. B19(2022)]